MCEYCKHLDGVSDYHYILEKNLIVGKAFVFGLEMGLKNGHKGPRLFGLVDNHEGDVIISESVNVGYCPMCWRKF